MIRYTGKHWLIITVAAICILSLYIFFKKTPPGIYWGKNAKQIYTLSYKETSDIWSLNSNKHAKKINLRAVLNFRIFEISDTVKAGIQFSGMSLLLNGKRFDALDKIYTTVFLVEFKKNGKIVSFHFSNELAPDDEKDIASIIKMLQLIIEKSITAAWDTRESDTLGNYYAEYIYKNGILHKKKLHYSLLLDEDGLPNNHYSSTIRDSAITATYGEPVSWIKNTSIHEKISIFSGEDSYATYNKTLKMKKTRFKAAKSLFIWKYSGTFNELIGIWDNKEKNTISFADSLRLHDLQLKYRSTTARAIIQYIAASAEAGKETAYNDLKDLISILPDESKYFLNFLNESKLNKNEKEMLINILADIGHIEARKTLCAIITSAQLELQIKNYAIIKLGSIKDPGPETVTTLWKIYQNNISKSPALSGHALSSLAQISQSLSISDDEQKQEQGEEIRENILAQFESAKTPGRIALLLKAAGKTGHKDAIDEIENYIEAASPAIRMIAASSLKEIENTNADELLVERLAEEENISVRRVILHTLLERNTNEKIIDDLIDIIPKENDRQNRELIYRYILKATEYAISDATLLELKENELSAKNKKLIDSIIKNHNSNKK